MNYPNRPGSYHHSRGRLDGRPPALDAIKVTAAKSMPASGTMTAAAEAMCRVGALPLRSLWLDDGVGADRAGRLTGLSA